MLRDIGLTDWFVDNVTAKGKMHERENIEVMEQCFSTYEADDNSEIRTPVALELSRHIAGPTYNGIQRNFVSHLGMYVTEEQLDRFRIYFDNKWVAVLMDMDTTNHSDPSTNVTARFHYVVFDTRPIIGVDLMFIVRKDIIDEV